MERLRADSLTRKKKVKPTEREYNTAVYLLRCAELHLSDDDMEHMTYGMILDMTTEKSNDSETYRQVAEQSDFDKF